MGPLAVASSGNELRTRRMEAMKRPYGSRLESFHNPWRSRKPRTSISCHSWIDFVFHVEPTRPT